MGEKTGISFLVRVRNEQDFLERSLKSLRKLNFPFEVVIVLHRCTDKSKEIATNFQNEENVKEEKVRIYEYPYKISRAGYELLATDSSSKHNLTAYSNFCLDKSKEKEKKYPYVFKWDADFYMTDQLANFLNQNAAIWTTEMGANRPRNFNILAKSKCFSHKEIYLSSSIWVYSKFMFWEVGNYRENTEQLDVQDDIFIEHMSELDTLKSYWTEPRWFLEDEGEEEGEEEREEKRIVRERFRRLEADFGPEPQGMARAGNMQGAPSYFAILEKKPDYINIKS